MSGPAFTPGPWFFEHRRTAGSERGYNTEIFTEDGGTGKGVIATCSWYPMPADEHGAIGTYRETNARLIAAAPDLYEAAQLLVAVGHMSALGDHSDTGAALARAFDAAEAALAKARGDQ